MGGYFLGGAASGFLKQEEQNTADQKQSLAERVQGNAENNQQTALVQKQISDTIGLAKEITQKAAEAGKDPQTVAKAIQPLIDSASGLAQHIYGPDGAQRVQQMGAALLAQPAQQDKETYATHVVTDPVTLKQSIVRVGKNSGQVKAFDPTGNELPTTPVAPINPGSPSSNLTGPNSTITGISVDGQPTAPVAPTVAAPAPTFNQRFAAATPSDTTNDATVAAPPAQTAPEAATKVAQTAAAVPLPTAVGGYEPEAIRMRAIQLNAGNDSVLRNMGQGRAAAAAKAAIVNDAAKLAIAAGASPEDINARSQKFKAETAGAQTLGKREATLVGAIANVEATAPIVAELSSKVNRTEYPLLNKIITAGLEQTGDPTIVRLGIALNTVTNGYARAQGGGNNVLTDSARDEAHKLLQIAYSDGQLQAGVDQLIIEMHREKHQVGDALNGYLRLRKDQAAANQPQVKHTIVTPSGGKFTIEP